MALFEMVSLKVRGVKFNCWTFAEHHFVTRQLQATRSLKNEAQIRVIPIILTLAEALPMCCNSHTQLHKISFQCIIKKVWVAS